MFQTLYDCFSRSNLKSKIDCCKYFTTCLSCLCLLMQRCRSSWQLAQKAFKCFVFHFKMWAATKWHSTPVIKAAFKLPIRAFFTVDHTGENRHHACWSGAASCKRGEQWRGGEQSATCWNERYSSVRKPRRPRALIVRAIPLLHAILLLGSSCWMSDSICEWLASKLNNLLLVENSFGILLRRHHDSILDNFCNNERACRVWMFVMKNCATLIVRLN